MQVALPPRVEELAKKIITAGSKNREWLFESAMKAKPGEPIPYDERLGITRDEYKEFLELSHQTTLREVATCKLHVVHNSDDTISLMAGNDELQTLSALKFDIAKNSISTPYGKLTDSKPVDYSTQKGGIGPYTGLSFKLEEGMEGLSDKKLTELSGKVISITFGKLVDGGRHFILYEASIAKNGQLAQKSIQMILVY